MRVQLFTNEADLLLVVIHEGKVIYDIIPPVYTPRLKVLTVAHGDTVTVCIERNPILTDKYCISLTKDKVVFKHCTDKMYDVTINF